MPEVISNTSPFQYLHQLGQLQLLAEFYGRVLVPQAVVDELQAGLREGVSLPIVTDLPWVRLERLSVSPWPLPRDIHRGEAEVLALAARYPGSLLLIDDRAARLHARAMGLRITGTAGVLLRAKREGRIGAVRPLLARLEGLGFHLAESTVGNILRLAGE